MNGSIEYATLKSPYEPASANQFNKWLKQMYDEGRWELVCPVNNYVASGNSRDDYLYIFRRTVNYELGL